MKAAVLYRPLDLRIEEKETPIIGHHDVLVRVRAVGICGSDIHYYETGRCGNFVVKKPLILGHECSGETVSVGGDVKGLQAGDRVAIEPGFPCGKCLFCKVGRYNLCPGVSFYGTPPIDGAFAEYVAAPADFVFKIPENMTFEEGALIEPLSVGVHASRRGGVKAGHRVAVFGAGPIGLVTLQACRAGGATEVYQIDLVDYRLKCAEKLGAAETINARKEDPVKRIMELTDHHGVDVAFEAAGSVETMQQILRVVRKGGVVVIIGMFPVSDFPVRMTNIVDKELDVRGVFRYANAYPTAIKLVSSGIVDVKSLITHRFSMNEIKKAFEVAVRKHENTLKVMILP